MTEETSYLTLAHFTVICIVLLQPNVHVSDAQLTLQVAIIQFSVETCTQYIPKRRSRYRSLHSPKT